MLRASRSQGLLLQHHMSIPHVAMIHININPKNLASFVEANQIQFAHRHTLRYIPGFLTSRVKEATSRCPFDFLTLEINHDTSNCLKNIRTFGNAAVAAPTIPSFKRTLTFYKIMIGLLTLEQATNSLRGCIKIIKPVCVRPWIDGVDDGDHHGPFPTTRQQRSTQSADLSS